MNRKARFGIADASFFFFTSFYRKLTTFCSLIAFVLYCYIMKSWTENCLIRRESPRTNCNLRDVKEYKRRETQTGRQEHEKENDIWT